ncbi:MAG: tRNA dimethylallyltransferase [Bacteroidales bacterium]|nr:tRNA dimethylallyltransferase [Bacteroidales bacterium]
MPKFRKPLPAALPDPETIDLQQLAADLRSGAVELVCVLGPTASGKTKYAVSLAHELAALGLPAEIISADSRQVYRGMDIGTGKDLAEYGDIPYHIIDVREAGTQYNVYDFVQDFRVAFDDIRSRGKVAILCGGTGLYINAVTAGYDFRSRKPLSVPSAGGDAPVIPSAPAVIPSEAKESPRTYFIGTLVSREIRNSRIDARLKARLAEGMIDEIRGLLEQGVPAATLIGYGLEYKFVTLYLQGELTEEELFEKLSTAIHQFAKRQMTWFRGMERSGAVIHWVEV